MTKEHGKSPQVVSSDKPVMAIDGWETNAELIVDVAKLGYLGWWWRILDPTYGLGAFWSKWNPPNLVASDIVPARSRDRRGGEDFRHLHWPDQSFEAVVFDPPYRLNGTPDREMDEHYGIDAPTRWQDRMQLIFDGLVECCRVSDGYVLVKCMDQVCSGKVRWQTTLVIEAAEAVGFGLTDRFDMLSYRPQPLGRTQEHARRNASTLLVLKRGHRS